jgi:hypothetical protein
MRRINDSIIEFVNVREESRFQNPVDNIPGCNANFDPMQREVLLLPISFDGVHLSSGQDTILASVFEGFKIESLPNSESVLLWEKLTAVLRTTSSGADFSNFCVRGLFDELRFFYVYIFLADKKSIRLFAPSPKMSVRIFRNW